MGVTRFLCRLGNPLFLAKDMRKSVIEEGSVAQGLKQLGKETLMDQIPFADIIYKHGIFEGERKGKEKISAIYSEKFDNQMEYFLEQKQIYETEIESLNILLDECEIRISQYESRYGTDMNDMSEEDKEKLLKLYFNQRKLEQLKKSEYKKEKTLKDTETVRSFINLKTDILIESTNGFKWFDSIEKIEYINRKMNEYNDECVLEYSTSWNTFRRGLVFGIKGLMYLEGERYVKYKHISEVAILKFPLGLKISVNENKAIVAENYNESKLVDVINTFRSLDEEFIRENNIEEIVRKNKEKDILKRLLESAWKMAEYPGELVLEEKNLNMWYAEYSAVGGFSEFVNKEDIIGKFRHNYFSLIFAYEGFVIIFEERGCKKTAMIKVTFHEP